MTIHSASDFGYVSSAPCVRCGEYDLNCGCEKYLNPINGRDNPPWLCGVDVSNNTCVNDDLYIIGCLSPNHKPPALLHQLDFIAAEPMMAWEDFKAIGYYGRI